MKGTPAWTAAQQAQAQDLATLITQAIGPDVLRIARLLFSKDTRHTLGQTQLQLRELVHHAGVQALELSLSQKNYGGKLNWVASSSSLPR
jgi:hypothetical protein